MCDPVTIAGIALTGLSAGLGSMAQAKVAGARDDAMAAERIRQQAFDREAGARNDQARIRYDNVGDQQQARAKTLTEMFQQPTATPPAVVADIPQSQSNITVQNEAAQQGKAKAFSDRTGAALGQLRAFGDLFGDINRLQGRDAAAIGQIGGFKKGSSGVLGLELEGANGAGSGLQTASMLTGALGKMGVNAGLSGAQLPGSALFGSTASNGSIAAARALDRASMPGYAAAGASPFSLF